MATITNRGRSQWQAKIRRKGYPPQSRTFDTKAEAQAWATSVESEMNHGTFVSRKEAEATSLREALERYRAEVTPTKKSAQAELHRIKHWLEQELADQSLAMVRGADLARYRDNRLKTVSANTVRLELALISHLFNTARREWGMESLVNPVENVRKPRPGKSRDRRLENGEEALLVKHASDGFRPVLLWAIETAMRREEIASLDWSNVDLKLPVAYLPETKNGEGRAVPLSSRAITILRSLPGRRVGPVFGMSPNAITIAMRRTTAKAGIKGLTFHDLRHEATSRFFERTGLDVMEIASITGHKSLQMLKRYTHLRAGDLAVKLG